MDWYAEGQRWFDRTNSLQGYALYGSSTLTHLRALLRLTDRSDQWLAARKGFYDRMREINDMSSRDMDRYFAQMQNKIF